MNRHSLLLGLALLVATGAIVLVALGRDEPAPIPLLPPEAPPATQAQPGLRATGGPAAAEEPTTEPPTEDAWLASRDASEGIVMGDDTLRGIVVDSAGRPIWDARVYLRTKPGQPAAIDAPEIWSARTDRDGRWGLEDAWAARSMLCAWAPGHERGLVRVLDPKTEIRVVLELAPQWMVTVREPPRDERLRVHEVIDDVQIRIRLIQANAREHPRQGEALAAAWDRLVETGEPTPVRIPRDVGAHLTADAPGLACEPAFVALPAASKGVVLQLVPSATIHVRLVDSKTKKPLAIEGGGWGYTSLTHVESGFELESEWVVENTIRHGRGVAPGSYRVRARYRGYVTPAVLDPIEVTEPGQALRIDVPLERDMQHATLHAVLRHADGSQHAGIRIEGGGLTLVRRREDEPSMWKHAGGMRLRLTGGREKRTLEDLTIGTYDILVWGGSRFPAVGHLVNVKVEGGTEKTIEVALEEGYGFRPGDALEGTIGAPRFLRVQSESLGTLPWLAWSGASALHATDAQGFAQVTGAGYIGPFPSGEITIIERSKGGRALKHALKASISPPK